MRLLSSSNKPAAAAAALALVLLVQCVHSGAAGSAEPPKSQDSEFKTSLRASGANQQPAVAATSSFAAEDPAALGAKQANALLGLLHDAENYAVDSTAGGVHKAAASMIDVRSSFDAEDGSWLLTVTDNGPGLDMFGLACSMHDAALIMHQMLRDSPSLQQRTLPGPRPGLHALLQRGAHDGLEVQGVTIRSRQTGAKQYKLDVNLADSSGMLSYDALQEMPGSGTEVTLRLASGMLKVTQRTNVMYAIGQYSCLFSGSMTLSGEPVGCDLEGGEARSLQARFLAPAPVDAKAWSDMNMEQSAQHMKQHGIEAEKADILAADDGHVEADWEQNSSGENSEGAGLEALSKDSAHASLSSLQDATHYRDTSAWEKSFADEVIRISPDQPTFDNFLTVSEANEEQIDPGAAAVLRLQSNDKVAVYAGGNDASGDHSTLGFRSASQINEELSGITYVFWPSSFPYPAAKIQCTNRIDKCKVYAWLSIYRPTQAECPPGYVLVDPRTPLIGLNAPPTVGQCATPDTRGKTTVSRSYITISDSATRVYCAYSWACQAAPSPSPRPTPSRTPFPQASNTPSPSPNPHGQAQQGGQDKTPWIQYPRNEIILGVVCFIGLTVAAGFAALWWLRRRDTAATGGGNGASAELDQGLVYAGEESHGPTAGGAGSHGSYAALN